MLADKQEQELRVEDGDLGLFLLPEAAGAADATGRLVEVDELANDA